jgi:hypothetical protein
VCVCVVALVSSAIAQQSAPAGAEIDAIVRQILEERLAAGDIPTLASLGTRSASRFGPISRNRGSSSGLALFRSVKAMSSG